jgi:hypothetical protein
VSVRESVIQHAARLRLGAEQGCAFWRNNVGVAEFFNESGLQRVAYGLAEGSSDLVGIASLIITPDMVGKRVGRFTAFELKQIGGSTKKSRAEKQRMWRELVIELGGWAEVLTHENQARGALERARTL